MYPIRSSGIKPAVDGSPILSVGMGLSWWKPNFWAPHSIASHCLSLSNTECEYVSLQNKTFGWTWVYKLKWAVAARPWLMIPRDCTRGIHPYKPTNPHMLWHILGLHRSLSTQLTSMISFLYNDVTWLRSRDPQEHVARESHPFTVKSARWNRYHWSALKTDILKAGIMVDLPQIKLNQTQEQGSCPALFQRHTWTHPESNRITQWRSQVWGSCTPP